MAMRVLVTGSSGFIGGHLVRKLVDNGVAVVGLDIRPPIDPPAGYQFVQCDIVDKHHLCDVVLSVAPHAVVHLAARTDLDERASLPAYAANTEGVENLVAAIAAAPSVARAIFTSTQLVCRVGYQPKSDTDYMPNTVYGESKVIGEQIVRRLDGGGVTWAITRPTTVWGPGMSAHYQRFFRLIRRGLYFHVGERPLLKAFGYVGNVAHQYGQLLRVPAHQVHRRTLYVGDSEPVCLRMWADTLAVKLGAPPIRTIPIASARLAAAFGDLLNAAGVRQFPFNSFRLKNVLTEYSLDMSKTREICGPNPFTVDDAAADTAAWILAKTRRSNTVHAD